MIEQTTWGGVLDGDRVVFGDPPAGYEVARSGALVSVRPLFGDGSAGPWSPPAPAPPADLPVGRLYRGPVTAAVATLSDYFDVQIIS